MAAHSWCDRLDLVGSREVCPERVMLWQQRRVQDGGLSATACMTQKVRPRFHLLLRILIEDIRARQGL